MTWERLQVRFLPRPPICWQDPKGAVLYALVPGVILQGMEPQTSLSTKHLEGTAWWSMRPSRKRLVLVRGQGFDSSTLRQFGLMVEWPHGGMADTVDLKSTAPKKRESSTLSEATNLLVV